MSKKFETIGYMPEKAIKKDPDKIRLQKLAIEALGPRSKQVLICVSYGQTAKEIAHNLKIAELL